MEAKGHLRPQPIRLALSAGRADAERRGQRDNRRPGISASDQERGCFGEEDPEHAVLAVVHGIDLDFAADPPTASGGKLLWLNPWHIRDEALTPIAYRYVLPSDEISKATGTL